MVALRLVWFWQPTRANSAGDAENTKAVTGMARANGPRSRLL